MSAEQQLQHEHAQWLASLASGHFQQKVVGSQDIGGQSDTVPDDDQIAGMAVSVQPIVRLEYEEPLVVPVGPPTPVMPFNLRRKRKERDSEEYKLFPSKDRGKGQDMRRPVRPIDRQKMRPWLKNLLDSGTVFGLNWLKRDDGIFQISWRHASRLGWNLETDGDVFERWARHTGIFKDGDEPEPKRWKANFRCALHSLPDVKELTCPSERKGRNATRTYRFLRPGEVEPPVKRKQRYSIQIPYLYDLQASEDSGSPPPESDERNTDEEQAATASVAIEQQPRAFPHCDHDYAIRSDCTDDEQISSAVLTKHNSGYVLIKSKDAHEFEFRLTALENETQATSAKKTVPDSPAASPQRKGKEGKKKSLPLRKGKAGSKILAKGKQQLKKVKKANDKEPAPATKVSLKALLSGRKSKAVKVGKTLAKVSAAAAKKLATKEGKKAGGTGKGKAKKDNNSSGPGTPTQSQGLQALLEAASQIDRLDAQTTASATAPTNTKTVSPARVTRRSAAAATAVSAAVVQPIVSATVQTLATATSASVSPALAAPVIFATQPVLTTGAGLPCGATMLAPLPSGISPQISLAVLQKLLGMSGLAPGTVTTVSLPGINSIPVQVIPSSVMSTKQAAVKPPQAPLRHIAGRKSGDRTSDKQLPVSASAVTGPSLSAPAPTLQITQPEAGTSMLKHLLRLTGPAVTPPASQLVPAAPKVFSTHVTTASPSDVKAEINATETEISTFVTLAQAKQAIGSDGFLVKAENLESYQMLGEFDLGSSQEVSLNETLPKSFPYKLVSTSKVYVKSQDGGKVVEASCSSDTGETAVSQISVDVQDNSSTEEQCEVGVSTLQTAFSDTSFDSQEPTAPPSEAEPVSPTTESRVTVCLQQEAGTAETLAVCEETVVVTLPQISLPAGQGQSMSTAPMDLMQFLNLFAAGGHSQVIIKAGSAVPCHAADSSGSLSSYILVDKSGVPVVGGHDHGEPYEAVPESFTVAGSSACLSGSDLADHVMMEAHDQPTVSVEDSVDISMQESEEGTQVRVTAANSVEVVPNQFIMNEADISSLSADHQGADSFVVDAML